MTITKWELARYLIDAKKCVDSIMFIARHKKSLSNINIRKKIDDIQQEFYIKCCVVVDNALSSKERGRLKSENPLIEAIYYERDKDKAHKDSDYKKQKFDTLVELSECMKKQISEVRKACTAQLPTVLTLDFVPHDQELFRMVHSLTPEKEEEINRKKYPRYEKNQQQKMVYDKFVKDFQDTEDLRDIPLEERDQYGVAMNNGINFYEGVQNRQDACIRINVLFEKDIWCRIGLNGIEMLLLLHKHGFMDEFDIPIHPAADDIERIKLLNQIMGMAST